MNQDNINFNDVNKKEFEGKTLKEIEFLIEGNKQLIEKQGLQGFFKNNTTYSPTGIVLDYDIEEVKSIISN